MAEADAARGELVRRLAAEGVGSALLVATIVGSGAMAARLAGGNGALALLGNTRCSRSLRTRARVPRSGCRSPSPRFGLVATILGTLGRSTPTVGAAVGLYIGAAYWFTATTSFANPTVTITRAFTDTFTGIAPADVPAFIAAQIGGGGAAALFFRGCGRRRRALSRTGSLRALAEVDPSICGLGHEFFRLAQPKSHRERLTCLHLPTAPPTTAAEGLSKTNHAKAFAPSTDGASFFVAQP